MRSSNRLCGVNVLSSAILLALALVPVAHAQDEAAAAEGEDDQGPATLEAVSVTATRKSEDVKDVPIAVSTISDDRLDAAGSGGDDIRFLSGRLPSLNIESSFGRAFPRFYVRGLGNTDFDLNASQPVSLVYDEIVQENPLLKGFPVFDLDRIELLRGPQGTLFGRNTPAGVVKFESVRPSQVQGGYAQVATGERGTLNFEGAVGGPLNEDWSARVSVIGMRRDDWVDNTVVGAPEGELEGYKEYATRVQLLYQSDSPLEALINLHARTLDGTARLFRANIIQPGSNQVVDGFDPDQVSMDGRNEQELDHVGANARLRWDFDRIALYSVTGYESLDAYSRGDIDGGFGAVFAPPFGPGFIPFPAETADGMPFHRQLSQEFRFESQEWGRFDWQAGVFWFSEDLKIDSFSYDTLARGALNGNLRQRLSNETVAAFGSIEYDVTEDLVARAGIRYTRDEKDFLAQRFLSPLSFLGAGPLGPVTTDTDESDVSWDLSATWTANEDINFYGRIAKGFRAPSIQGRLLFGDVVSVADSETVLSYEVGMKADLFDRRARVGASIYHYTIDDQQLTAVGGQSAFNTLINAEESVGRGIELEFEAYITDSLLVAGSYSYNHTEIRDDDLAIQPCGGGCTVLDPAGPVTGTVLLDGNPLPQSPENIYNLSARWGRPVGESGEFYVYTDWYYRDEINFFLYESAEFTGDPLLEGGLRIGYTWDSGLREVALFGRNILDETEVVGGIDFNNLTGFINEPRVTGIEFTARF